MSKKAVLRTAQDIFVLDKAFFLIEGHPSDFLQPLIRDKLLPELNSNAVSSHSAYLCREKCRVYGERGCGD
jgi:hypothetical protein